MQQSPYSTMIQRHLISTYFVHLFIVSIIFLSKNGKTFAAVLSLILKSLCFGLSAGQKKHSEDVTLGSNRENNQQSNR